MTPGELRLWKPNNERFLTVVELVDQGINLAQERDKVTRERDDARKRAEGLAQRLCDLGFNPDA